MDRDQELTDKLLEFSNILGVDLIGFADPANFEKYKEKYKPKTFLKEVNTVVIVGMHLYDIILDAWSQDQQTGRSFHYMDLVIENLCHSIKEFLIAASYETEIITYSPGLFLKDSAALAGIGPIGKNNLLITEDFGSQVRLRAIVTTAPLIVGEPFLKSKYCDQCNICIESCPANALEQGKYKKAVCLAYNLSNLRKLSEYTSIWCNLCIETCPISKRARKSMIKGFFSE